MPNPWDVGSARALEQLGFKALATTSAGLAWTLGRADTQVTRDQALDHLRQIADAVTVPVKADFEDGYASEPAQVAENVKMAADNTIFSKIDGAVKFEWQTKGRKQISVYPVSGRAA